MRMILASLLLVLAVACGGGSGGGYSMGISPYLLPIPAGIYVGQDTVTGSGQSYFVVGAVAPSGAFRLAEIDTLNGVGCFGGTLIPGATSFSGTATQYDPPAYPGAPSTFTFGPGLLDAMPWTSSIQTGSFAVVSVPIYTQPPTFSAITGNYQSTALQNNLGVVLNVTLAANGSFTGSDPSSTFSGTLTQITPGANLYNVTLTLAGSNTTFTGLAFYNASDPNFQANAWYLEVNCPTYGLTAILQAL